MLFRSDDAEYEREIERVAERFRPLVRRCKELGRALRIGTNHGSLSDRILNRYGDTPGGMVESALEFLDVCEDEGHFDVVFSMKASNPQVAIHAYRLLASRLAQRGPGSGYPFHLGVTEAGPPPAGLIKSVAGIATLLNEGIGDTIRFSLTADPVEEAKAGRQLLENLGLRERKGLDLIACPSCGRAEVDVIEVATSAQRALEAANLPVQVAVMGCVVNGPGEAREADIGIAAGRGRGHLFIKGQVVRVVPEGEMVEALLDEVRKLVDEGLEARLAHAEANAAEIAEAERLQLIEIQGDANRSEERRAAVAEVAQGE